MTEVSPAYLGRLIRSVAVLALPGSGQVEWLRSLGLGDPEFVDELAQELEEGVRLVGQFESAGWVSEQFVSLVLELDSYLAARSGSLGVEFWRVESLLGGEAWDPVRELARRALSAL